MTDQSCEERVAQNLDERMQDLRTLWQLYQENPEATHHDLGNWDEYGLCFDYVPRGTFTDQKRGYFVYQLSTGGPGDEFRFYTDETLEPHAIEYWFLDWFDGASIYLRGSDYQLLADMFAYLKEGGAVEQAMQRAKH